MIQTTKDVGVLCARKEQDKAKPDGGKQAGRTALYSPSRSDREQLAAMLSSNGRGHVLADRLLFRFGSVAAIAKAHPADLTIVEGIGQATAARLAAAFQLARRAITEQPPVRIDGQDDIAAVAAPLLHGHPRERLVVVICNRINRVIGQEILAEGSANRAVMPVREAIVAVLRRDGQAFALAHNHPSGDPTPSKDDVEATLRVQRAAEATGLRLIGHVVMTDTEIRTVPGSLSVYWATRTGQVSTC
jgi:DNA repair protein RadC